MLIAILFVGLILLVGVLAGASGARATKPPSRITADPDPDEPTPSELALEDPLEALRRYGTPDDAARLSGQGVDLGALGYRPPRD